jgi:hypothetical protein
VDGWPQENPPNSLSKSAASHSDFPDSFQLLRNRFFEFFNPFIHDGYPKALGNLICNREFTNLTPDPVRSKIISYDEQNEFLLKSSNIDPKIPLHPQLV